ncbi:MAG TPA: ABC transporter substrate-binding protein [Planctomycetota bacterium]|nr:ABC transporter substrate-binding protein [Planctomycetota bacterium]
MAPFRTECAPGTTGLVLGSVVIKVLEAPFDVGPELTWRPRLVSEVGYTRKPPFTLTYHIRPEASWSDGTPITARDFVFTHQAILKHGSPDHMNRTEVRSVRVLDPKTAIVVLRSRFAGWRGLFGNILPSHALQGEDLTNVWTDRIVNPKTGRPIGSGPFLVERWERGKQITFVRNPRYWGPHPAYLDRLVVRFGVQGNALLDAFRRGELDIAASGYAPDLLADLTRQEPGIRVLSQLRSAGWDHFEIRAGRGGHPALGNKLVRRALAYGIDRAAIARDAHTILLLLQDSDIFARQTPYYRPNWSMYRYRPSESRRLLERAGCRPGSDGIYVCAEERLRLRFVSTAGVIRIPVLGLVQKQLRLVGVEVVPTFASPAVLFDQILPSGDFDVALFAWVRGPEPEVKPILGCGGPDNYTGYCQRLVTADLDQAERIFDADQQARVLNRADAQMAKDVPVIPLYLLPQNVALRSTVRNFGFSLNRVQNGLWNAESWWLAD